MSRGPEGSVVAEYAIDVVYKKGAKANQLNGEKNPPAKASVVIVGALLMGMVILAFTLKVSNVYQTHKKTNKQTKSWYTASERIFRNIIDHFHFTQWKCGRGEI